MPAGADLGLSAAEAGEERGQRSETLGGTGRVAKEASWKRLSGVAAVSPEKNWGHALSSE